jgi:hypothetical protein
VKTSRRRRSHVSCLSWWLMGPRRVTKIGETRITAIGINWKFVCALLIIIRQSQYNCFYRVFIFSMPHGSVGIFFRTEASSWICIFFSRKKKRKAELKNDRKRSPTRGIVVVLLEGGPNVFSICLKFCRV